MGYSYRDLVMKVIYRISDAGYKKEKPAYINNETCLINALREFNPDVCEWTIIADNVSTQTQQMIERHIDASCVIYVSVGHGAGTFNLALDLALKANPDDIIYFLENDYLHKPGSLAMLKQGFELDVSFVALYDHPDKYIAPEDGGNPLCKGGAEETKVFLTQDGHWKITNSTTMTFAAKQSTLKKIERILRKYTNETYPRDYDMFTKLRKKKYKLITPIPGYATHGETAWLSPLTDWSRV